MARDRRPDPVGRFVINMIGEPQFGRLVHVVFQEVIGDFECRTLNGVLPLAGTGPIVAPECGYLEYVVPLILQGVCKGIYDPTVAGRCRVVQVFHGCDECDPHRRGSARISPATRAFTLCRAHASLIREAWPEGRLPLVEGEFGKSGDAGRRRSLAVVEKQ